jgi:hypothetical protein
MKNNHIVFGICFCHRLHPIEWWERIIVLLGSMSFALLAINIYYVLWGIDDMAYDETSQEEGFDPQEEVYQVSLAGSSYVITKGTLVYWTFGGLLNSIFDFAGKFCFVWLGFVKSSHPSLIMPQNSLLAPLHRFFYQFGKHQHVHGSILVVGVITNGDFVVRNATIWVPTYLFPLSLA